MRPREGLVVDRRAFIGTVAGGLLAAPLAAEAQPAGRMYRIGYLAEGPPPSSVLAETLRELRELGYAEGQNLVLDRRFGAFKYDRQPVSPPSWCGSSRTCSWWQATRASRL
jgi:putative ABC transport system substrate-binding protein